MFVFRIAQVHDSSTRNIEPTLQLQNGVTMRSAGSCRFLMIQGTASHAGKSTLVAALCRILARRGVRVAPFKAQNMSLNSAATSDGGEIGRAQMLQAAAARTLATVHMNPVLLKPQGHSTSQIIVHGDVLCISEARDYYRRSLELWPRVVESLDVLREEYEVVIVEGAGSPAEINMRDRDIANMRVALHLQAPVLLAGDIERGGVFASLYGTVALLREDERALVRGFVINKFRGDPSLLADGPRMLRDLTGIETLGVIPFISDIRLPEEDSLGIKDGAAEVRDGALDVAVIRLPHIANFDDFDPLRQFPRVRLRFVSDASEFGSPHLMIIPGSKSTVADLGWMRRSGVADRLLRARDRGTPVVGICGGYQMLGMTIIDERRVESTDAVTLGLGLLPVTTYFASDKRVVQVAAQVVGDCGLLRGCAGERITGYEIHHGQTRFEDINDRNAITRPAETGDSMPVTLGVLDETGRVLGTYMHGMFHNQALCCRLLANVAEMYGLPMPQLTHESSLDAELDRLANHVEQHLNMDYVDALIGLGTIPRRDNESAAVTPTLIAESSTQ